MTVHVIGAGLAGLAAALDASRNGHSVVVHEAKRFAGGRCRSFGDPHLDRVVDNGTHLVLGANTAVLGHAAEIAAHTRPGAALVPLDPVAFPFFDVRSGRHWVVRPSPGRLPLWIARPGDRVAASRWWHYLGAVHLARGGTVERRLGRHPLYDTLWRPLTEAILNADPAEADAALLWRVLQMTVLSGAAASRVYLAPEGLSAALIDPALATLAARGVDLRFGRAVTDLDNGRCLRLSDGERIALTPSDSVIVALPPDRTGKLVPQVPTFAYSAIVNGHFRVDNAPILPGGLPFVGLVGGTAHWIFVRGDIVSVTVSNASGLMGLPVATIGRRLWRDVAAVIAADPDRPPPMRLVKEGKATVLQTPEAGRRRCSPATAIANVYLAGDWTATGLPATIEGAILSGRSAASCIKGFFPSRLTYTPPTGS